MITAVVPGAGLRSAASLSWRAAAAAARSLFAALTAADAVFLAGLGTRPAGVVGGDGVGVEGVEREVRAGVAEVVLFPPPASHPPDHGGSGQRGGVAAGQDVHLAVLVAAGDLPQRQHLSLVLPAGDRQADAGLGEVVAAFAPVVPGPGHRGELAAGDGGDVFPGLGLAVGEQVEPGRGDVREQVRGPAAPVKAQHRPGAVAADGAQLREQGLDLGGQRG